MLQRSWQICDAMTMQPDPAAPWFVGAYPLLPKTGDRSSAYRGLVARARRHPGFSGLEVPFSGDLDVEELAMLTGPHHELVITTIPGTVALLAGDAAFGLASPDEDGRRRALSFARKARDDAQRLHDVTGRRVVRAVNVHSSSAPGHGSPSAFRRSIHELAGWGWDDALLLVEHCDAALPGRSPSKGFLSLGDELDVLADLGPASGIGLLVNWGRSAIEGRAGSRAVEHLTESRERGLLRGLMFSGCSDDAASRGGAWADVHLPPAPVDERSILDAKAAASALAAVGDPATLDVLGMKVGAPAEADLVERERILDESARILRAALRV
jgi:hypothetical protein